MSEAANVQTVKSAYAAFQRGDVKTILGLLADDVQWEGVKGTEGVLPQAGKRQGHAAVSQFFAQVAGTSNFETFEPREFVAQGDTVVAIGRYSGTSKPSGNSFASDWVMVFTFRNGQIATFREFVDSAQIVKAFGQPRSGAAS
jgi:ketosteroid isomerase-like protein